MDKETEEHVRVVSNGNAMLPADQTAKARICSGQTWKSASLWQFSALVNEILSKKFSKTDRGD